MGQENIRNRTIESRGAEVVKMQFSESDLRAAKIARLSEIKAECEQEHKSIVFLTDIAAVAGRQTDTIKNRAEKLGIKLIKRNNPDSCNKIAWCMNDADAERIIRSLYQQ